MDFLKELINLFSLKKVNYDTANRKTLDSLIKKVKLQERRQALFELSCERNKKKSRVHLCKKDGRPGFAQELGTLSTKKIRKVLTDFLKSLGLDKWSSLLDKGEVELQKIGKEKGWERVLFMSDSNVEEIEDNDKKSGEGLHPHSSYFF